MKNITLEWVGPFNPCQEETHEFKPQNKPGIYIWAVGSKTEKFISYVGKAANLKQRLYQHMVYMLGGSAYLYEPKKLKNAEALENVYKPAPKDWNLNFIENYSELSTCALENLKAYEFFWVEFNLSNEYRKAVESGIINSVIKSGKDHMMQINEISIYSVDSPAVNIVSNFPSDITLIGLDTEVVYGTNE